MNAAEPVAVGHGVEPANANDGLTRMVEGGIVPESRWLVAGGGEEGGVLLVRDGKHRHSERRQRQAMRRAFVGTPGVIAHRECARRDEDGLNLLASTRHKAIVHAPANASRRIVSRTQ